ncbi:MAG: hypothetical protein C0592_07500 [Marinilabiliales bacterium]|nr:MAG: hypothetical protein C0592_07500 [Marinilabiliales bacterium]
MLNTLGAMDNATNYTYFGARYYDSDLSVWLSVDPASDMYPGTSPYMYVRGNPIMRIDPNGMWDIGYTIDELGNVEQVDNTGGNDFDVIYNKKDYEAGKRDYDETGTKSGMKIDRGEVSNPEHKKYSINGELVIRSHSEIKTKEVADNLFNFLAANTNVEWSNQNYTKPDGTNVNVLTTSRERTTVRQIYRLTLDYLNKDYTLNTDDHNHPNDYELGGKVSGEDGDMGYKSNILNLYPVKSQVENATFRMFWRGKEYPY